MKTPIKTIARLCSITEREALLYAVLSAGGWLFFAYQYLYASGLGVAVPKYAGY